MYADQHDWWNPVAWIVRIYRAWRRRQLDREREVRAFEALIVSQLRFKEGDKVDVEHLPALTDKEQKALDSLGPDFIKRLLVKKREGNNV